MYKIFWCPLKKCADKMLTLIRMELFLLRLFKAVTIGRKLNVKCFLLPLNFRKEGLWGKALQCVGKAHFKHFFFAYWTILLFE